MFDVELLTNNQSYIDWKTLSLVRSIEQLAGGFEITGKRGDENLIKPGEPISLFLNDESVLAGYVDAVELRYDSQSDNQKVVARDVVADLVDCSLGAKEYHDQTLLQVASDIALDFNIEVQAHVDTGAPFKVASVNPGDSPFSVIERLARARGLLIMSDATGALIITRAGLNRAKTSLQYGVNILGGEATFSHEQLFSEYTVVGDRKSTSEAWGSNVQSKATATDDRVGRYRPFVFVSDTDGDAVTFKDRATWQRNVAFGRAKRVKYSVPGWYDGTQLWQPNTVVKVEDPRLNINEDLLIVSVTLEKSERGAITSLELTRPEAFDLIALPLSEVTNAW